MVGPEDGKVVLEPGLEEADFGDEEDDADGEDEEVGDHVEELKVAGYAGQDDHCPARGHDHDQGDEGHGAEGVED